MRIQMWIDAEILASAPRTRSPSKDSFVLCARKGPSNLTDEEEKSACQYVSSAMAGY
jgi:hypothetical protein